MAGRSFAYALLIFCASVSAQTVRYEGKSVKHNNSLLGYNLSILTVPNYTDTTSTQNRNICIIGNSTITSYAGQNAIAYYMSEYTITDISWAGDKIVTQLGRWNDLSDLVKNSFDYVFVEIGLNDLGGVGVDSTGTWRAYERYQNLINKIRSDTKSTCKIIGSTMTPAAANVSVINWTNLNEAIMGNGVNAINNLDDVCYEHTYELNDGSGALKPIYDTGDGVHENNLARTFIALVWKSKIF